MKESGVLRDDEKWHYENQFIEIVKKYKYLGMEIKPSLKLDQHFAVKITSAKANINSIWSSFVNSGFIHYDSKINLLNAIGRSSVCSGRQYWGFEKYEEIEIFYKFLL